jgi:hypothetical protein
MRMHLEAVWERSAVTRNRFMCIAMFATGMVSLELSRRLELSQGKFG